MKIRVERGEHNFWKGGISEQNRTKRQQFMKTVEYRIWRTSVFKRDNYTCQICNEYGGMLHADHIKSWAEYPKLRLEVDNGRTLCVPCHYYVTFKSKMRPGARWCNFIARMAG